MAKKKDFNIDPDKIDTLVVNTIKNYCADTIYFKDRDSRFIWNSQQHADQLDAKSPSEMYGKTDYDYFPKEFADVAKQTEEQIIESGEPMINIEEEWEKEHDWFDKLLTSAPLHGDGHTKNI